MDELNYQWYDSNWLKYFNLARRLIAQRFPASLQDFEKSFDGLKTPSGFKTVKLDQFFDPARLAQCRETIRELDNAQLSVHELLSFGRLVKHDLPGFSPLHAELAATLSEFAGEELAPSYNFLSLYNNLGVCEVHLDAPSSKWNVDVCIEQSADWPIYISQVVDWPDLPRDKSDRWAESIRHDPALSFDRFVQQPGDALFFSGSSQWHYRERIPARAKQNYSHLVFFHFYPKGLETLIRPECWADHFGISELNEIARDIAARPVYGIDGISQTLAAQRDRSK